MEPPSKTASTLITSIEEKEHIRDINKYINHWEEELKSSPRNIDPREIRLRLDHYHNLLQGVPDWNFNALVEDFTWNIQYYTSMTKKSEKSRLYGVCDVCNEPLKSEWYHCSFCKDCYDECDTCWKEKKKQGKAHPHSMKNMVWSLYEDHIANQVNILTFDGGGIRGYLSMLMFERYCVQVKKTHEKRTGPTKQTLDQFVQEMLRKKFHLISGTSIGGIIAIMLGLEIPLSKIKNLFKAKAHEIFPGIKLPGLPYSNEGIRRLYNEVVKEFYPNRNPEDLTFGDLKLPVAVTSFNIRRCYVCWFSTQVVQAAGIKLVDAVLSTSAAPTYFPIHTFVPPKEFFPEPMECIDGGVWGNDPRLMAYFSERVRHAREHRSYNIISFGTGGVQKREEKVPEDGKDHIWRSSTASWLVGKPNIIEVILAGGPAMTDTVFPYMNQTGMIRSVKMQINLDTEIKLDDADSQKQQEDVFERAITDPQGQLNKLYKEAIKITGMMGIREKEGLGTQISVIDSSLV